MHRRYGKARPRLRGAAYQQHLYAERARCGYLAVRCGTSTVLRHDHVNVVGPQELAIRRLFERSTCKYVARLWNAQRWLDRIDAANQIVMLGRSREGLDILATQRKENAPRGCAEGVHCAGNIVNLDPPVTGDFSPRWAAQRQKRNARLPSRLECVSRNPHGVRMSRIDQPLDGHRPQIPDHSVDSPEPSDPSRRRLSERRGGSARERQCHGHLVPVGKARRQVPRLRSAAQNQNVASHVAG
jgi:hypothetical protein